MVVTWWVGGWPWVGGWGSTEVVKGLQCLVGLGHHLPTRAQKHVLKHLLVL